MQRIFAVLATLTLAAPVAAAQSDGQVPDDRTLSPYFVVETKDSAVDALPLKSTDVKVRILGVIADVVVVQRYTNAGSVPLEARYVFPASTRAAVHAMNVRLGDRLITAEIREKAAARAEYDKAKAEGRTAALLEQHRENVFQMHVGNILPGDDVRVELSYTELLAPVDGVYRFVYPTVVGPRYNGAPGLASHRPEPWIATPHRRAQVPPGAGFALEVGMEMPVPAASIGSPSHRLSVRGEGTRTPRIVLAPDGEPADDRDFVLQYRLEGDAIQSGILLSEGREENFFLAMVQPPAATPAATIVPREYVFVVDVSGSMHGFPLDTARALMNDLLTRLRPSDTFNLLLFAGDKRVLAPRSVPATADNVDHALATLAMESGGGGTELLPALREALAMPADRDRARVFVVITDGNVSIEREAFDLVRRNLSRANLFAFGIGSSVNRMLIEGLARAGQGEPFIVLERGQAAQEARRFREMIESPVMTRVAVRFEELDVYDVVPAEVPDLFARRPIVVFGKWRGDARGAIRVTGSTAAGPREQRVAISRRMPSATAGALRYLWARHRIAELSDQESLEGGGGQRAGILALGFKYHLLTQYTSFVAIDRLVRVKDPASSKSVDQALPLPKGVSELAVSESVVPGTPEPSLWALTLVAMLFLAVAIGRRETARLSPRTRP